MRQPEFAKRVIRVRIPDHCIGIHMTDGIYRQVLMEGEALYWNYAHEISCKVFNLKVQQLDISGQEILTADKVGIRLNILCSYRITKPLELVKKLEGASRLLYTRVQLAAREYVGQFRLDELLAQKEEIGRVLGQRLLEVQEE